MGHLTIGASDTVTSQFLLPYLERFHRQYPAIHIQIVSGRSHKVLGLLQSGKVDIAFASTPQESASLETHPCFATHSVFVAAADYPCDFGHVYSLAEIAAFPLILLERKASSRLYLEKYFLQNGQRLHPEIELGARSLLVDLAAIGFGVAGVTEEFVHEELSKGRLRKLATDFEIPPRSVDLCVLRASDPGGPAVCRLRKGQLIPAFRYASELGELTNTGRKTKKSLVFLPIVFPPEIGQNRVNMVEYQRLIIKECRSWKH